MSTTTSTRRTSAIPTTLRTETVLPSILLPDDFTTSFDFDADKPTPTTVLEDTPTTTSSSLSVATCSSNKDCAAHQACSKGTCVSTLDAAPLGGGSEATTRMSTGAAVGVGLGMLAILALLLAFGFWFWKRRKQGAHQKSSDDRSLSNNNHNRSASSATDQKTLVASLPNSPQNRHFRGQGAIMLPAAFAKLHDVNAHGRQKSSGSAVHLDWTLNEKALPLPPTDMPLPPEPIEEKRYAINVNNNKSMIFDDGTTSTATVSHRTSQFSRGRMPKYRFEEYLPPVATISRPSLSQDKPRRSLEYELGPYPRKGSANAGEILDDETDDDFESRKGRIVQNVASGPPKLPSPNLPPPSPSLSFRSYDWYQDIIGTERTNLDDDASSVPNRSLVRTPTKATSVNGPSSNSPDRDSNSWPISPINPTGSLQTSFLHPKSAALPGPATLPSPTAANFRLPPTVYTMPSTQPKSRPMRASLQSATTAKTQMSRSWLPDEGLYLPEEGTRDTFTMYKRRMSDESRPTSYTPL